MGKIKRGIEITKKSFKVIKHDKEILLYPILSTICVILISIIAFLIFYFTIYQFYDPNAQEQNFVSGASIIYFLIYLFIVEFIVIFFKASVIGSATIRFNGKNPTLSDGLGTASKKSMKLFSWSVVSAIVGLILNALGNLGRKNNQVVNRNAAIAGGISSALFGMAWGLLTFFTIPVILYENYSTIGSIRRSGKLFKKTWGENLTAQFSIAITFVLLGILGLIPIVLGFYTMSISVGFGLAIIFIAFAYWGFLAVLSSSVSGVFVAALYHFATKGKMPEIYRGLEKQVFTKK